MAIIWICECEFIYNREEIFFYGHVIGSYVTKFTAHSSTSHPHTNAFSNLLEDSFPLLTTSHWQTWLSTVDTETKSVQLLRQKDLEIYLKSLFLQLWRLDKRWWSKEREEGVETWGREEALASPWSWEGTIHQEVLVGAQEQMSRRAGSTLAFMWETSLPQRHGGQPSWK